MLTIILDGLRYIMNRAIGEWFQKLMGRVGGEIHEAVQIARLSTKECDDIFKCEAKVQ